VCMTCFPVCRFLACLYIGKDWLLGMGVWERGDGDCGRGFGPSGVRKRCRIKLLLIGVLPGCCWLVGCRVHM